MKTIKITLVTVFLCSVPFAIWYNLNYDKYGSIDRLAERAFIRVCAVDTQAYNNSLRQKAAEYAAANRAVKIFILPFSGTQELSSQIDPQDYDIKIVLDGDTLHAFISKSQTANVIRHCEKFLGKVQSEAEYKLIWKKS